jgi:hypothetical protein
VSSDKPNKERKLGVNIGRGREWDKNNAIKQKNIRLNVWVESNKYAELKELAKCEDRTVSDIIRYLIDKFLVVNPEDR